MLLISIYWLIMASCAVILALSGLFNSFSKSDKWDPLMSSSFECGFSSYYFSRFSFSIHYFLIGLTFLLLDLELCFLFPLFLEESSESMLTSLCGVFILILILGVLKEWMDGTLEWLN